MKTSTKLRREAHPACAWTSLRLVALAGVAAVAGGLGLFVGDSLHAPQPQVAFLQDALGPARNDASLERRPAAGTVVRLRPGGYRVRAGTVTVGLRAEGGDSAGLERFEHGSSRRTEFGWEAVTVSPERTEQFLTVVRRQGPKTWRWQLQTLDLVPRVGADGAVAFIRDGRLLTELWLAPPRILDANQNDVTPAGVQWALEQGREGWSLALDLDDSALPLPYVIDPAIVARTPASSANTGGGADTVTITKPAGLVVGDLLLAQITTRGGTAVAICPPTTTGTWTSVDRRDSTTNLGQEIFRLSATAADVAVASYAFELQTTTCGGGLTSRKASGGIVAYVDTANQANPIDVSNGAAFASAGTVTPPAVTPTVDNSRIAAFYGAASGGTVGANWTGVTGELWDQSSSGGSAGSRSTSAAGDAAGSAAGVAFTPSAGNWASANTVNIGQTLALAPLAADGSGTLTTGTTNVAASATGHTISFTYTVATGGIRNGSVTLAVPAGWSAPSTTATAAGYTTSTSGAVGVAGQTITVSGLTLTAASTFTITYGSTAGGGPGATASVATGAQTWQAQQRSSSASGALTNLGTSPSITVNAANGSGTLTASPTDASASSSGNTLTFTYTAAAGGMSDGAVRVTVPTGWSAPSTTGTAGGYTTASTGSVGVAGQVITVTGVNLAGSATMTIAYGSTAGGGPGATATGTTGSQTWQGAQRSVTAGPITNLAASPSVNVNAADGSGTLTTPTTAVPNGSTGNTFTFTYTSAAGGMTNGAVRVTVPAGWSAPSTTVTAAGYTTASTGTVGLAGQVITVTGVTLAGSATMTVTYGSNAGGGPGATAPSTAGAQTWQAAQRSVAGSTITNLAATPSVTVLAADGTGTLATAPTSAVAGSTGNTVTLTYTAASGGMSSGAVRVTLPAGWSAPSTTGTAAGYTTASTGTVGVAGQVITVTGVTLAASGTLTITYGSTAGGGPGATAPTSVGAGATWQGEQRSSAGGTFTSLVSSPTVTIVPGALDNFLVEAAGGGPIGTQAVGVAFSIRVTARDVHGNTVTAFDGSGNTVDITSSGTLSAGGGTTATLSNGVLASHSLTLGSTGSTTVTATRTSGGSQSGTSASFATDPGTITNTAPVSITGTAKVGESLSRSSASWSPGPDSRTYQWRRCDSGGGSCADISGATGTDYTLAAADLGQTIRVVETASKAAYSDATSTSAQTAVVAAGDFTNTAPASITGTAKVGESLSRSSASWTPGPDTRSYQWRRCDSGGGNCADISGATGTDYTLAAADLGQTIRVVETASKAAYSDATSTSAQTAVVAAGDFTNTAPASITGTAKVGEILTRSAASWTPGPDTRSYQWRRCDSGGGSCADISGATGTDYTLAAADLGQTIRVVETATKTGYNDATSTSAQTAVVAAGDFTNTAPASITGTAKVGEALTRSAATWTPGPDSRSYQWRRCDSGGGSCADLTGETGTSYTLAAADLGQTIRLVETASKTAYNDATSTSAQTSVVAAGVFTNTTPVSITGTAEVGDVLTRSAASWTPAPDSRAYQWRRCDSGGGSCADLTGETGTSYTLVAADVGQTIRLVETASKTAYDEATSTSAQTAVVAAGTITNTAVPTVSGTPTVSFTLTATGGSWTPSGTSSAFQWVRCDADGTNCVDRSGETAASYVVVSGDVGKKLKVRETASKTGYATASADSALTAVVSDADSTPPTNTIVLGSPAGAYLTGTTLYYRPSAAGSFALSSSVSDSGAGPGSAAYPAIGQAGWTHGSETVTTPAGGPYVSSAFSWTGAASGDFSYIVTAGDAWSPPNTSQTTLTVTEDSAAPASGAQCNGAACSGGWYTSSPVSVTLAAADGGAGVDLIRYTTDGTDPTLFNGTTYMGAISVAAEGTTTVKFRSFDRVGNTENVQTQPVSIDTVAPDTTIDGGPSGSTSANDATFTFSSNDGAATFECRLLPGGSWGVCASPKSYSSLAENTYTFEVRATDVAGNTDGSEATRTWTVDTTAADTTITGAPPADTNATGATFSFTASDAGPNFECRLDGGSWSACTSPKTYAGLSEASHTFGVRALDTAGNTDPTPAQHTWTVDTTAPDTTITLTPSNPSANTTPTFNFSSSQAPSSYACNLDGGGWGACATPHTIAPALADGSHTLEVRATDAAGNTDATPASTTWLVDATAPTGSLTAPADGSSVSGTIVVASDSADAGGSGVMHALFERSPAGAGSWTTIGAADTTSPYSVSLDTTGDVDGDYDLRVTTRDNAGNSTVSALYTVEVDNTAPSLTASAPNPVNLATADPAAITANASDAGSGVASVAFEQCNETSVACDSDTWTSLGVDTTSPYSASWPLPTDGMRLLRVRATDGAGRERTELVLTTVDRTAPTGTVTVPSAGANLRADAAVSASASDPAPGGVGSVEFQITAEGAAFSAPAFASDSSGPLYDGTLDTTGHADGLYDLRAFVNGVNGNSSASARVTVRIDNTPPTGSVTSPAAGANLRGTVNLTSSSADGGSGVATVQFERSPAGAGSWTNQAASWNTTLVADGQYDLRVVTTDNAGGSFTSAPVAVRVDNTAPTGSVTSPAAGANLRSTVTLTSDSADSGSGVATVQFQRSPAGAGSWANQAASWNTTSVADGLYDVRVVTTDNAGGSFTSAAVTVRIDNTAPTGTTTAPANGAEIGLPPVTLTSNSADGGSGVDTIVFERRPSSGGSWTATPAPWDTAAGPNAVGDGSYEIRVTTTDLAGNVFTSGAITVLVDHTAPVTTSSLSPASPSNAPVTVSFSAGDAAGSGVAQTAYRVDGGSTVIGPSVVIPAPGDHSNDGAHLVEFFSTDDVGNVEATKSTTVVIDTTAPGGSAGDPGSYLRGIALLSYATSDTDVSSVQFQFSPASAGAWVAIGAGDVTPPYEVSWSTTLVADGSYDLRAVVTDGAANVSNVLLPGLPKYVDNTTPAAVVSSPPASAFVSGTIDVTATGNDGASPPASGVAAVRFELKPAGAGSFTAFGTETVPAAGSTYKRSLDTTPYADGPAELRVVVTDRAGNETTSAARTITIDNMAPTVTLNDPGPAISGTPTLTATAAADTASVTFEQRPAGGGAWTAIGTDSTPGDGFSVTFATSLLTDGVYELRAQALDGGGNSGTSSSRSTRIDNELPTGSITSPGPSATVGGSSVGIAATAADTGSGVASVEFTVKPNGAPAYSTISTDSTAPYDASWDASSVADGTAQLRLVITDAAGNQRQSAVVPVTVDSTGPSVTLNDPGAVLSGPASLTTTTGGGAARVVFGITPAGAGSWTQVAEATTTPFGATLDTATFADGLYDLRAIGYDALGNASAPAVRNGVRFDNTAPRLVSSTPQDGSVSTSATEIALTASEPVVATGTTLDGSPAPSPAISGSTLTFATGSLADGLHVLSGWLEDASGTSTPFRVAVTIESTPAADRPPVERSGSPTGETVLTSAGSFATATLGPAAWPLRPSAEDFIVIRVDPTLPLPASAARLAAGTAVIEVTARWALAGTEVTQFRAPIAITIPNRSGAPAIPAVSENATSWRPLRLLDGHSLPAGQPDGFYRDAEGVHVLTRHLTYFALLGDVEPPTPPRNTAGVVLEGDGLTLRWTPGTDDSGELGDVILYVNGESYRFFDPTQFEAKLGAFTPGDTRTFTFVQVDAAGNRSDHSPLLRGVPAIVGIGLDQARTLLAARGFAIGELTYDLSSDKAPGTVLGYEGHALQVEGTKIPLRIAGKAPEAKLAFDVAVAKRLVVGGPKTLGARLKTTRAVRVTASLRSPQGRLLRTWRYSVRAGVTIVELPLPMRLQKAGLHRLVWVVHDGTTTTRRSVPIHFMRPFSTRPALKRLQVLVASTRPLPGALPAKVRVVAQTDPEETYSLSSSRRHDVRVVVVDVDAFGIRFFRDLRRVFPYMRLVAVSADPGTLRRAKQAGASVTLRRDRATRSLAYAILGR